MYFLDVSDSYQYYCPGVPIKMSSPVAVEAGMSPFLDRVVLFVHPVSLTDAACCMFPMWVSVYEQCDCKMHPKHTGCRYTY